MVSKACVVGAYQRKLEEIAARPGIELLVIVPPYWQEEARKIPLERLHTTGYCLEVEPIRFNGRFHLFHFPGLARRAREFRPDVVHVDEEPYNLAGWQSTRIARQLGARCLFFTWQNICRNYPPPFRWMEQYCFHTADRAIAGNQEAAEVLRRKGFQKPVDVIPQFGVDPGMFRPSSGPHPPASPPWGRGGEDSPPRGGEQQRLGSTSSFRIGFVGRLVEQKGILDLLEAVARLEGDRRLLLVGAGPLRPRIQERAVELGLSGRLEIIAGVPSRQMPEIMSSFDALVLPSRTRPNWKEQFGRALVEAMACQVPVVGSNSGEIPNVIGDAGLVFPEGDVAALRDHLAKLQASQELREELGQRGRARVLERFTQARVAEQTCEAYHKLLR